MPRPRHFAWRDVRLPVRLSARAALCLCLPLLVGIVANVRVEAIIFTIGALWGVSQDGLDAWPLRRRRLGWLALATAAGTLVGGLVGPHVNSDVGLVVLFAAAALVAGLVEASGNATAGAYLLVGSIVSVGLHFDLSLVRSFCCFVGGILWVIAVAAVMDARGRRANQAAALARAYRSIASVVDRLGTEGFYRQRADAVAAVDAAQDIVGDASDDATRDVLVSALCVGELVSYLVGTGQSADPTLAAELRHVATTLVTVGPVAARGELADVRGRLLDSGTNAVVADALAPLPVTGSAVSRRVARGPRRTLVPWRERARFALLLAVATAAATLISEALHGPNPFWLPLTVGFVLRPDLGPVITRAGARALGTFLGACIAWVVVSLGNSLWMLIALSVVMAAGQPWAARRSYVLSVMTFTPLVFVFLGLLGPDSRYLSARVIDTLIGGAIVLLLDLTLWTTAPSLRPRAQLDRARRAAATYARDAPADDPLQRNVLRREALRAVAHARSANDQAAREPALLRRHDPAVVTELDRTAALIDATTVALVEGRRPPRP